jgi:ADP-ribose pyrophosphatase YjhB (NUDIX family)
VLPGVSGVVVDDREGVARILLVKRADDGRWSLPAGIVEPDEQPADTITREILEEACVTVVAERLVLLTMDPENSYPNGDRCQFLSMTFRCRYVSGVAGVGDEESTDVAWFALGELPALVPRELRRISCALAPAGSTVFDSFSPRPARTTG